MMSIYHVQQYQYIYPPLSSWVPMNDISGHATDQKPTRLRVDKVWEASLQGYGGERKNPYGQYVDRYV